MINQMIKIKMKVLSYLEACNLTSEEQVDYFNELNKRFKFKGTIAEWFLRPFSPELIIELFEGWVKYEHNGLIYYHNEDKRFLGYCVRDEELYLMYSNPEKTRRYYMPRTLDDFINDCQRAGIELTWRAYD